VDDYLDGALDEATRDRVKAHLGECERCRSEFNEAKRYRDAVHGLPRVQVPDDFLKGIHDRLDAEAVGRKRRELFPKPLLKTLPFGVAAAAVAAFALVFVFHLHKPDFEMPSKREAEYELQTAREDKRETVVTSIPKQPETTPESTARFETEADENAPPAHKAEKTRVKSAPEKPMDPGKAARPTIRPSASTIADNAVGLGSEPLAITLVLERPSPPTGSSSTTEAEPTGNAERAQEAETGRATEPKLFGTRRGVGQPERLAKKSSKLGDKPGGETRGAAAGSPLDRARNELASIIMNAGGRIIETEAEAVPEQLHEEAPVTIFAELPAPRLSGFLDRLGELGQIQTDGAVSFPEAADSDESVELRILLINRPPEDTGIR
jgi:hypothetical protein